MSESFDHLCQRIVVRGGAVVEINLLEDDLPYSKPIEAAYYAVAKHMVLAAPIDQVEKAYLEECRLVVDMIDTGDVPGPLDVYAGQAYAFLETYGIAPGDKHYEICFRAVLPGKSHAIHGPGVDKPVVTTEELAIMVHKALLKEIAEFDQTMSKIKR